MKEVMIFFFINKQIMRTNEQGANDCVKIVYVGEGYVGFN